MAYRYKKNQQREIKLPWGSVLPIFLGVVLIMSVVWPILTFILFYSAQKPIVTPLPDDFIKPVLAQENPGVTSASNWFPGQREGRTFSPVDKYFISIPKIGIHRATVSVGTDDLSKSIVHYGGTALPGKPGNTVLFGHSVLPSFYDPKNYLTIFSLLPQLKVGDDIYVKFDGVDYRYEVEIVKVTDPTDVSGLEQRQDDSYLTLVTCVPPGTYFKRLWLTARQRAFGEE